MAGGKQVIACVIPHTCIIVKRCVVYVHEYVKHFSTSPPLPLQQPIYIYIYKRRISKFERIIITKKKGLRGEYLGTVS